MERQNKKSLESQAYRLIVEYDGTRYVGWQRQPNGPTIQAALETAIEQLVGHPVRVDGSGRTDTGVHALGQVARFATSSRTVDGEGMRRGANSYLPGDVRILAVEACPLDFDPRRDARLRHYRYSILNRPSASALDRHRLFHVPQRMDWPALEEGLRQFEGEHDFRLMRSSLCQAPRTILTMEMARHVDEHPVHHLDFKCRSFLHSQIRMMVGLLLEIGLGKKNPNAVREVLESERRKISFRTAPPHGLVLVEVVY